MLKNEYHIIVPILDGHAGSDRHFSTIESNAQDIALFINENLGGSVFMLCGLSLGGQILLEMLSQQGDICDQWFAKIQFSQLKIKSELFDDYYRDTCAVQKKDMLAFLKANTSYRLKDSIKNCAAKVNVFYGEKESPKIKKSAKLICGAIPLSTLTELPGMHHGDFSINHSPAYVRTIKAVILNSNKNRQPLRSIFRNTSLSSLQGDSLAASFASSCEKYPRKSLSTFYLRLVLVKKFRQYRTP